MLRLGGGINHRFNLSDEFLIKDNHISYKKIFVNWLKKQLKIEKEKITVEIDNLNHN